MTSWELLPPPAGLRYSASERERDTVVAGERAGGGRLPVEDRLSAS